MTEKTNVKTPDYEMFTEEGNKAVHDFLTEMHKAFWSKIEELKKAHPEITDTATTEKINEVMSNMYWWNPNERR